MQGFYDVIFKNSPDSGKLGKVGEMRPVVCSVSEQIGKDFSPNLLTLSYDTIATYFTKALSSMTNLDPDSLGFVISRRLGRMDEKGNNIAIEQNLLDLNTAALKEELFKVIQVQLPDLSQSNGPSF